MNNPNTTRPVPEQIRTLRIILMALCMGVIVLGLVFVFAIPGAEDAKPTMFSRGALLVGLVAVATQSILGNVMLSQGIKNGVNGMGDVGYQLAGIYQGATIVSAAIVEGAAMFNLIIYFMERDPWNLAMAGLLVLVIAFKMITVGSMGDWIARQERAIKEMKSLRQ